jgi:hypothetical protein
MDKETLVTLNLIKKFVKSDGVFESYYHTPYSENELPIDVKIPYKITKISLHKKKQGKFKYEGVIYVKPLEVLQGVEGQFETGYSLDDIPEYLLDDFTESIVETVDTVLSHVYLEIDFTY